MLGHVTELTRGRLLARNVGFNLAGWLLPAIAALATIPALLHSMGPDRFGLLSLAWTLVGYFSVFDLGVGRALTQALSERVGVGDEAESPRLTWSALWLLVPFGVACGAALAVGAPALAGRVLTVPPALRLEAVAALRLLAVAVPWMVVTSGLRAVLEAGQRFRTINALRVPLGILTFVGPWGVQNVTNTLPAAVAALVVVRVLMFALHAAAVARALPALRRVRAPRRADFARLWRVAGWMTVSSVVSPVLVSVDRFVVGAVLPMAAVAHYATASEVATKMWLFTAALQPVIFPALAATLASAPGRAADLFDRGVRATALALAPAALVLVVFAREGLTLWLGAEFARAAAPLLQWLAVAVFANAIAQMPYAVMQGGGRADVPGKLHLVELPLYLAVLWALLGRFGVLGVALAWLVRMAGDGFVLLAATPRVLPQARAAARRAAWIMASGIAVLGTCTVPKSLAARAALGALVAAVYAAAAARWLITPAERTAVQAWWRRRRGRPAEWGAADDVVTPI